MNNLPKNLIGDKWMKEKKIKYFTIANDMREWMKVEGVKYTQLTVF